MVSIIYNSSAHYTSAREEMTCTWFMENFVQGDGMNFNYFTGVQMILEILMNHSLYQWFQNNSLSLRSRFMFITLKGTPFLANAVEKYRNLIITKSTDTLSFRFANNLPTVLHSYTPWGLEFKSGSKIYHFEPHALYNNIPSYIIDVFYRPM